jgi:hypothetical protein
MKNIFYTILFCLAIIACNNKSSKDKNDGTILSDTSVKAVTPLTGLTHKGQPIIWWVEKSNDEINVVKFAYSKDMGNSFEKSIAIPITAGCNDGHGQGMPKIVFKKDGTMLVVYHVKKSTGTNPYAGKLFYSQSFDFGTSWEAPKILHQDTIQNNSHGFPTLTVLPDGEIAAIWLDGRNKLPYSEIFMARTEGNNGFVKETTIGGPSCQCCKLDFYTDADKSVHVLYRGILGDNIRDIMHIVSSDNGNTYSSPIRISEDDWQIKGCPHAGPGMVLHQDSLHYVWFTMGSGEGIFYCKSDKSGKNFSTRENLAKGISKYPAISSVKDKLTIAWQEFDTLKGKDQSYNRVKMQVREKDDIKKIFITNEGTESSNPSTVALGDSAVLVAYQQKLNNKTVIAYKKINLISK